MGKSQGPGEVINLTDSQTIRPLAGETRQHGMAILEARKNMPLDELILIEALLPNDARRISNAPHPSRPDLLMLVYTSELFPPPGEDGEVGRIEVRYTDSGQMAVNIPS